ncbi:MAG TPA: ABC transporter ATP-binding protein [Anaerolineae bacterium]|nr:ABC transporter ATP-binding protein [Anaerolineae bacterium]
MAQVHAEVVCKQFGEVAALDRVSCAFEDGQLTVLVGPSGCGKTTLLRTIAGLEEPSSGSIYIGEENVDGAPAWERNIAMVFQSYALYPHMTVFKNMAFPLEAAKFSKDKIRKRVHEAARILQIEDLLERKPRELSGGQMQRVALGRAIVREPDVFLMDEPLSNLDAKLRVLMRAELKHLQSQLGVTTIYVTHDQAEAMTLADKLIVMHRGCIQQIGKPEVVYRFPRNRFVAGFIGSPPMNFLNCCFDPTRGLLVGESFDLPAGAKWTEILKDRESGDLILGVRPEDMSVGTAPSLGAIRATVYVMEQLGREILLNATVGEEMVRAFVAPDAKLQAEQEVWLTFDQAAIHLFDGKTEEALSWHGSDKKAGPEVSG